MFSLLTYACHFIRSRLYHVCAFSIRLSWNLEQANFYCALKLYSGATPLDFPKNFFIRLFLRLGPLQVYVTMPCPWRLELFAISFHRIFGAVV